MKISVNWKKICLLFLFTIFSVFLQSVLPLLIVLFCLLKDALHLLWPLLGIWVILVIGWEIVLYKFNNSGIFKKIISYSLSKRLSNKAAQLNPPRSPGDHSR